MERELASLAGVPGQERGQSRQAAHWIAWSLEGGPSSSREEVRAGGFLRQGAGDRAVACQIQGGLDEGVLLNGSRIV